MLYIKSESLSGNVQYVNAEKLTGFKYDKTADVTTMYVGDTIKWSTPGDATAKILSALRKSGTFTVVQLGEQ